MEETGSMKPTSILLALVVVLGFVNEARAQYSISYEHDYTIHLSDSCSIGINDVYAESERIDTRVYFGPFGSIGVPFTATQGLIGFCCVLATLMVLLTVLSVRWKRKRAAV
jgi:hypothetical protein